jgi:hypothetical protein
VYGPVRTVVWQGSAGDRRPYADLTSKPEVNSTDAKPWLTLSDDYTHNPGEFGVETFFHSDNHTNDDAKGKTIFQADQREPRLILAKMNPAHISKQACSDAQQEETSGGRSLQICGLLSFTTRE